VRIIGGRYRGRRLRTCEGFAIRPTSDRLRETLFDILSPLIKESLFGDVCAGSGAVGIEAISRGASHVTFIESSRPAVRVIEANLAALGITEGATILQSDALIALKGLSRQERSFDLVFFDPPYDSKIYPIVMDLFGSGELLASDGLVVVEHRAKNPPAARFGDLVLFREVRQGQSSLAFYKHGAAIDPTSKPGRTHASIP
jgi:16S rRNA (guanine966-N2)-methyltransferase